MIQGSIVLGLTPRPPRRKVADLYVTGGFFASVYGVLECYRIAIQCYGRVPGHGSLDVQCDSQSVGSGNNGSQFMPLSCSQLPSNYHI